MPQNLCSDLPIGNFQMEGPSEQVRHNNSFDEPSAESGRWPSEHSETEQAMRSNKLRSSNRSFHNLRHPQQDLFLALNQAAGYGHFAGFNDRAARTIMSLGQQMVADRQRSVPPVHRVADTEVSRDIADLDLAA